MKYMRAAIAKKTRLAYDSGVANFRAWRIRMKKLPDETLTANDLVNWMADLADGKKHSAATIKSYKAAVSNWYAENVHPDNMLPNPGTSGTVRKVLQGIERIQSEREQAQPLRQKIQSEPLLYTTLQKLKFPNTPYARMYKAAAYLGVAAGLRPGELLGNANTPERALLREQVRFYSNTAGTVRMEPPGPGGAIPKLMEVILRVTKTIQFSQTEKLVQAPDAIAAVWTWSSETANRGPRTRLFQLNNKDERGVSIYALTKYLERIHVSSNLGHIKFTGKSFRQGGASTLAIQGYGPEEIAALGWAPGSKSWEIYANDPQVQRQRAIALSSQMQKSIPRLNACGPSTPR
jgi:hypothetical protein